MIINDETIQSAAQQASGSEYNQLVESQGWFLRLEDLGEKGQTPMTLVDGTLFFTTFVPAEATVTDEAESACSIALGNSFLYAVNAFTGAPVFEEWSNDEDALETEDRRQALGTGPAGQPLPITLPGGSYVTTPTKEAFVPGAQSGKPYPVKTYWYEK